MKNILILSLFILTATTHGQTITNDSTVKVIYSDKSHNEKIPACFINENFVGNSLTTLNPNMIENINIIEKDTLVDNIKYYGQIHIKMKNEYKLNLVTLTSLKDKYTNLGKKPVVYMIDGDIVNADYNKYIVDENYILQLVVDNIKNEKENIDLVLIKLLTKSDENIKKSKEIRIRGNEVALNK